MSNTNDTSIRLLNADEIEVRVGAIYKQGITLLLYKNARVDMYILDEVFGPMNWKRRHFRQDDATFCEIAVRNDATGEWIGKTDVGAPTYTEPIKGAASDAFKRAGTNWGIGRELYTSPFLWVDRDKVNIETVGGKEKVKDNFFVQTITYDNEARCITGLVIANQRNQIVFQHMEIRKPKKKAAGGINAKQTAQILDELKRTGIPLSSVLKKHNLTKISDMSPELWKTAMEALQETGDKAA